MDYTRTGYAQAREATRYDEGLRAYMLSVYNNMALALGVTGVVALLTTISALQALLYETPLKWLVVFAPIVMVFMMSSRIMSYSVEQARTMLGIFSALMGLSIGSIFMEFTHESIARVFFITAAVFGAMSLYGYTSKKDLTSWGSFFMMGLIGIILASLVNIFLGSPMVSFVTSILSVVIFTGLTAYDTQALKRTYYQVASAGEEVAHKAAVFGALTLYLDFINIFLSLLRFFGESRRD